MTDAERIAAAVEQIKLATAGAEVNEKAARRLARRLSRWLRRHGVNLVGAGDGGGYWETRFMGFHSGYRYAGTVDLCDIAANIVESVSWEAEKASNHGDVAYHARHKLEEILRKLGAL